MFTEYFTAQAPAMDRSWRHADRKSNIIINVKIKIKIYMQ